MARARNLKPALFKNEILGEADPLLTLLFVGLWCLADREGRLEDRPKRIKAEIFPYRELPDFNGYLTDLERLGFIVRYKAENQALIQVINFVKHQSPHKTEKPSELPPPPAESMRYNPSEEQPLDNGALTVKESLTADSLLLTPDSLEKPTRAKKPRARADKPALPDPPAWLPSEAWERWQTHRQEIRKPLKPTQAAAQFDKLAGYRSDGHDPVTVIDHSIAGGWQGLFPPDKPRGTNGGRYETAHDRIQRACADPFDDDDGRTISGHAEAVEADGGDFWGRQVGTSLRRGSQ